MTEDVQFQLVAGVFVDKLTGQPQISTGAPEIDPVLVFAEAIKNIRVMEAQHNQKKGPEILVAGGPLPKI